MVGVVELHVGEDPELGLKFHQGAIGFIGFCHQQPTLALATVAAKGRHDAADHGGGVVVGGGQERGNQGAGGGFAMAASHGNRGLGIDQGRQHIGAVANAQAHPLGFQQFGVRWGYRRADDHQGCLIGAAANGGHRGGALLAEDPHALASELVEHGVVAGVGSAHHKAPLGKNSCDGRHADASNPNEVDGLMAIKQRGQGQLQARD